MKKPTTKISDDECQILGEDRKEIGKTKKELLRRKVKRISSGKGKLVSELIREMRC